MLIPTKVWRETWLGEGHQDFTGYDDDQSFGRIQLDQTGHCKMGIMWKWNITHIPWVREHIAPHSGWEAMSREACRRVEELYEKLLELHGRPKHGR
ncbi:hypothetical protein [Rhizobium leguminosarum]|uniref:hypothetical protein n=1 Tax=Rhizobium leguminosarum TaxID=384 RepID=UPI0024B36C87|nr:hypothetical protein [Rhizobium leguminosarum]WHO79661.1 hypothetical protein QMO81_002352 [Rhizobium leguminosarum]